MQLKGASALGRLVVLVMLVAGATAWAEQRVIDLAIRAGELAKDKQVVRVRQGDEITLRWTTDQPLSIHLHGYDIENKLSPGRAVSMQFTARATGRFPIEIHPHGHGQERTVGYLEVHPR
jgi:hypothetical protein